MRRCTRCLTRILSRSIRHRGGEPRGGWLPQYYWVRNGDRKHENYNYRVSVFRCPIIERTAWRAPLYGLKVAFVDPGGTSSSREHSETMKRLRLNRHTTSAYVIAKRTLENLNKPTKT